MGTLNNKTRVIIVEERRNPSTDFFIRPQFPESDYELSYYSLDRLATLTELDDAIVVLVRYLSKPWRQLLTQHQTTLRKLIYFMDDDLFDWRSYQKQSFRYQFKLFRLATRHGKWISHNVNDLWVSTPYLANKYASIHAVQIDPKPLESSKNYIRVFYHGSASHKAEIDWLFPVVQEVLQKNDNVVFEIIGDESVNKCFKALNRVQVIHPMSWEMYQAFIKQPGRHIGLVPLLNNSFNHARSHTKVFDIRSAGAVGIYAEGSESAVYVQKMHRDDELTDLILPMDKDIWVNKIIQLSQKVKN